MNPLNVPVWSVSQLNRSVNRVLAGQFLNVWVEGEISNLTLPVSGHWYFSLKDAKAQVRCAMFKSQQRGVGLKPENGQQVLVKAQVSLYEPRGDYQLVVEALESAGNGALQRAFEALKTKLANEGLFASEHKKPLPTLPRCIGIITSPTGAAIHDILTVLKRRFPAIPLIIYPVTVQGESAPSDIARAIACANQRTECDVLIVGRGGGSLEDLWAFNDERIARAIFASQIPIISAVGHESDITIADFVADFRAPTPSAAAECATPDQQIWLAGFVGVENRLTILFNRRLQQYLQGLDWLAKRLQLQQPGQKLTRNRLCLTEARRRLHQAMHIYLTHDKNLISAHSARLGQFHPARQIKQLQQAQNHLETRLHAVWRVYWQTRQHRLANLGDTLNALSPLATLNRGYALVISADSGRIIHSTAQLQKGSALDIRLVDGSLTAVVTSILPAEAGE